MDRLWCIDSEAYESSKTSQFSEHGYGTSRLACPTLQLKFAHQFRFDPRLAKEQKRYVVPSSLANESRDAASYFYRYSFNRR